MTEDSSWGTMPPSPGGPSTPHIQRQLASRVRAILANYLQSRNPGGGGNSTPSEDYLLRCLKSQFPRDYGKVANNDAKFKSSLTKILASLTISGEQQQHEQSAETSQNAARDRLVLEEDDLADEEQARKKQKKNALNAVLSSNYAGGGGDSLSRPPSSASSSSVSARAATTASANNHRRLSPQASLSNMVASTRPTIRYSDLGGLESHIQQVKELCEYPLTHPEVYAHLGVQPPKGVLLFGSPGTGKTMLAHAIAGEVGVPFFKISAPEIVSGMSGESEEKLRTLFNDAVSLAPSLVFIDEIDAITSKRESSTRGMELRIVAQLLTCMDGIGTAPVVVLGATNRPDALDTALRRAGRFDREIELGAPDEAARERILRVLVGKMRVAGDFDFRALAHRTPGFVGADLAALTKEAAMMSVNRVFREVDPKRPPLTPEELEPLYVEFADFERALPNVQPSAKREGFATVPSVTWEDVGALADVREELTVAVSEPIRQPERFRSMGLSVPAGVLLFGPPGCGKTLVAKAIASSSNASFISVKGPELLNKYVGESERAVRQVFARARASAPCVIFFDELDALCPRRGGDSSSGGGSEGGSGVSERVVNQLLTELDGIDARKSVFVIAATNRPELIDPAMLRPGRLDRLVYVPLPGPNDRAAILKTCARSTPLMDTVDLTLIGRDSRCEGFSGADLSALVREASISALRRAGAFIHPAPSSNALSTTSAMEAMEEEEDDDGARLPEVRVAPEDFETAFARVKPSVSERDRRAYERMKEKLNSIRGETASGGLISGSG